MDLSRVAQPGRTDADPESEAGPRVAAIDAERLRNSVAARLFGAAADPVRIGRFTVLQRLGQGGMGVVYSAYDTQLDRKIAIKLLRGVDEDGAHMARLTREAQALAKLSHPNVVQVFELGTFRSQVFVAMEFVEGKTLREWSASNGDGAHTRDTIAEVLDVFSQAGRGLAAAHEAGLVHRDFKPDNVLVGDDGRVRVVDFGLARGTADATEDEGAAGSVGGATLHSALDSSSDSGEHTGDSLSQPLTRTGAILGTPAYMAPEQHFGQRVDARSDQFSFCVALWEKLYGDRPFQGRTVRQLAVAVMDGAITDPGGARNVPVYLRRALERGLSTEPGQRWPSMDSLLVALSTDPRRRRRWIVGAAGLAAALAAFGTWAVVRDRGPGPCEGSERELEGVWDDDVRARVERAFAATETPYADDAWQGTARQLDAFADDWVRMHRRVCEASVSHGDQSPELLGHKMVCLGQRLTELEQLTELLADADADTVSRAVVAAGSLGSVQSCDDARALLDDPVDDERMAELERKLASANGRKALGKYDEGMTMANEAIALARDIGTPHGEGRALLVLGEIQVKRSQVDEAKQTLREALRRADVAGDDGTRVRALTQLMRVSYLEHDLEAGEVLAADARAALERLGDSPLLEADFYMHYASLAHARDDNDTASEYHERALEIRIEELGADHPEVGISMNNIANALRGGGRYDEAETRAREALAIFEAKLGSDHPYTAAAHNNIGNSLLEHGRLTSWDDPDQAQAKFEQAAEHYAKAVAIREANLGADHPSVALNLHNLGEAQRLLGRYAEARDTWQRSLEIKREHLGSDHPSVTVTMTGLGRSLLELGEVERALELLEEAAEHRRKREATGDAAGETYFALARAVHASAAEQPGAERDAALKRAAALAKQARAAYEQAGDDYLGERREVSAWIAAHPAPADASPKPVEDQQPDHQG